MIINEVSAPPALTAFARLIGPERTVRLRRAAEEIRERLAGGTLWHVNSTPAGGGVAEMLQTLLPVYTELGVRARWAVIGGTDEFFRITKRLGVALYGSDDGPLGAREHAAYLRSLSTDAAELLGMIGPRDIVVLHDHQTAGLAPRIADRTATTLWRCHVGVDEPTPASELGWDFIGPLLDGVRSLVFSVDRHVPARFSDRSVHVLPPFISPFGYKNAELGMDTVRACLDHCGLGAQDATAPPAVRTPLGPVRLRSAPTVHREGTRRAGAPLVTQISRWDRLKDMGGVLDAFTGHVPQGHLALVGPDPAAIADDTEQRFWYADCVRRWQDLTPAQRARVTLVALPMADLAENALLVNGLQRSSDVVVQKSLAEGFGLTVAEAMWKRRVVVGSAVGGIRAQITDGVDGFLLSDPADLAGLGALLNTAIGSEVDGISIGARAHQRVHTDFLADREVTTTAAMLTQERMATS
ncbi:MULTISPECIES: glycosyltransferase [Catenuloplanes]|uniref:Trehalose synthase n=1 Tax=Catenuloplanes niger TaxID=587534 RepID=A0AAE3ZMD1_9ACTN|nr:glycosyltransferase [Catenuloplanes niger]MDR7321275.1 trehalose synthase [Catenuloplanes niger]